MIDIAQDREGLRHAALELMEEEFAMRQQDQRHTNSSATPEYSVAKPETQRTLSPGYYKWLGYIVGRVEDWRAAGVLVFDPDCDAEPDELPAIDALSEAFAEFDKRHPRCCGCGEPQRNVGKRMCDDCLLATSAGSSERVN